MNPWQQLKLTFLTVGAVLRGNALAPGTYKAVPSAVRSEDEADRLLAEGGIRGGLKAGREAAAQAEAAAESQADAKAPTEERDVVLSR